MDFPGVTDNGALDINETGAIVGQYREAGGSAYLHGYLLSNGAFTTIAFPGHTGTVSSGINGAGQVVGFYRDAGLTFHGFLADPAGH